MDTISTLENIFSNAIAGIISTISGVYLEVLAEEDNSSFEDMVGTMNLSGQKSGMLFVSAKAADMRILCSYMTGIRQEEVTNDELKDALCEIVNMTAGNAKVRLSGSDYAFNLSSPFVISGQNMKIAAKNKMTVVSGVLGNGEITIKFKVVY